MQQKPLQLFQEQRTDFSRIPRLSILRIHSLHVAMEVPLAPRRSKGIDESMDAFVMNDLVVEGVILVENIHELFYEVVYRC